jgi:hypothetical protein
VVEADERTVEMEEHLVGVCPPFVAYRQPAVTFYVASDPMEEFEDGLPEKRMKLTATPGSQPGSTTRSSTARSPTPTATLRGLDRVLRAASVSKSPAGYRMAPTGRST